MAQKILIVDDDMRLRQMVMRYLDENGFKSSSASNANEMCKAIQRDTFDLYVLDINLPGEDGLRICQRIRLSGDVTPIIMVTARGEDIDRIIGLELGADDYLPKPFNPRELLARIRSILRRGSKSHHVLHDAANLTFIFGSFEFDGRARQLSQRGKNISLTTNEFALLKILIQCKGQVLSRAQLTGRLHSRDYTPDQRDIDMLVSRLRKQLQEDDPSVTYIQTVRGVGYVFIEPGGQEAHFA
ncbi:response regulator [Fluviibacter phosphoraccumulans]|uniref:response regulator n=1 Tax=Fluviibacter phosphoraccumulans TaxID=1751046 RepID=UPI0010B85D89|nr:response regulator [Fluviibacter phosphoraccumulans]BCA65570.1 DNA-binding response regulator [Fluviibacter phosphoraccumulans]